MARATRFRAFSPFLHPDRNNSTFRLSAIAPLTVVVNLGHATTDVSVPDLIQPSTVTIFKVDAATQAPLAGAVMDTKFDRRARVTIRSTSVTARLGRVVNAVPPGTTAETCFPGLPDHGNHGSSRLPRDPTTASQTVTLEPGVASSLTFDDHLLVPPALRRSQWQFRPCSGSLFRSSSQRLPGERFRSACRHLHH